MQDDLEWRTRLRKRLAIIADYGHSYQIRLSAVRSVLLMLGADHHLCRETPDALLGRVLRPHDRREFIVDRRAVMLPVRRPPQSLLDVWE